MKMTAILGACEEALQVAALLIKTEVRVLWVLPERELAQWQQIWLSHFGKSVNPEHLVRLSFLALEKVDAEWSSIKIVIDMCWVDDVQHSAFLQKATEGTVCLHWGRSEVLKADDWSRVFALGNVLESRSVELRSGSQVLDSQRFVLEWLEDRLGLRVLLNDRAEGSVIDGFERLWGQCFLQQLEAGIPLELLKWLWLNVWGGPDAIAPDQWSAWQVRRLAESMDLSDELLETGVLKQDGPRVFLYRGNGKFSEPNPPDLQGLEQLLSPSDSHLERSRKVLAMGGNLAEVMEAWIDTLKKCTSLFEQPESMEAFENCLLDAGWLQQPMFETLRGFGVRGLPAWGSRDQAVPSSQKEGVRVDWSSFADRRLVTPDFRCSMAEAWCVDDDVIVLMMRGDQSLWTPEFFEMLQGVLSRASKEQRALVWSHAGHHVGAAEDWSLMWSLLKDSKATELQQWLRTATQMLALLSHSSVPVVFAADGYCVGASHLLLDISRACVLGPNFTSGMESLRLGLPPAFGLLSTLVRRVGELNRGEQDWLDRLSLELECLVLGRQSSSREFFERRYKTDTWRWVHHPSRRMEEALTLAKSFAKRPVEQPRETAKVMGLNTRSALMQQLNLWKTFGKCDDLQYACGQTLVRFLCGYRSSWESELPMSVLYEAELDFLLGQWKLDAVQKRYLSVVGGSV